VADPVAHARRRLPDLSLPDLSLPDLGLPDLGLPDLGPQSPRSLHAASIPPPRTRPSI
jgi:hypothetical protein